MDHLDKEDLESMSIIDDDDDDCLADEGDDPEDWRYENLTDEGTHVDSLEWDDDDRG